MSKLYIVGNGFDIAHNLCTKYEDFHSYLNRNYKIDRTQELRIPITIEEYHKFQTNHDKQASFLVNLIDKIIGINSPMDGTWEEFETYLGKIPYNIVFNNQNSYKINSDDFLFSTLDWEKFFREWITLVNNNCIANVNENKSFKKSINFNDLFFTTNYTSTLESVYKIQKDNICHIHGNINNPYFGHNEDFNPDLYEASIIELANSFHESLRKNCEIMEEINSQFFDKIKETYINEIIIYGNSISKPDKYYFRKIFEIINNPHLVVRFTEYDESDKDKLNNKKQLLKHECGFIGEFKKAIF